MCMEVNSPSFECRGRGSPYFRLQIWFQIVFSYFLFLATQLSSMSPYADACQSVHGEWESWTQHGVVGYHLVVSAWPAVHVYNVVDGSLSKDTKLNTFALALKAAHGASNLY